MSYPRPNRRKPMSQINVVPYIDVMLVLLVIFMVTAPMLQQGVEVNLPKATAKPVSNEEGKEKIVVSVTRDGKYFLDSDGKQALPMSAAALTSRVAELLSERKDKRVYVRGDTSVDYGRVVAAMVALQAAGASGIGLITEPQVLNNKQ